MTPFETVLTYYTFPERIKPHPLQIETINDLAPLPNSGEWLDMGTGKSFCSTATALFHKIMWGNQIVIIMPPVLLRQWGRWLAEIKPALTVTEYQGTPAKRAAMDLEVDVVLVGVQIFKKENKRFVDHFFGKPYTVILDEATFAGNVESDAHHLVYDFCIGHPVIPLTGTPMNNVMDAYAMLKFSAPGTYPNIGEFVKQHVDEFDYFKRPIAFKDLDVLAENMKINSKRILFEDMYPQTELPLYDPIYYDLEPAHYKLYSKLAEEELLKLPDGGKIDGTTANKLMHALGQIICNWSHFSGVPSHIAMAIEMIEQKLAELGEGKLLVFAHYKMTVAFLKQHLKKYKVVTANSEVSNAQKDKNVQTFIHDPRCRVMVAQVISAGKGLDGMQGAANHIFFAEPCQQPRDFHQAVARLHRLGQKRRVHVMMGIANGTTQVRAFKNLLDNDTTVNKVIRNAVELRAAIYGQ